MNTYVYTIPKDTPYIRRDQPLPITMPTVSDIEKERCQCGVKHQLKFMKFIPPKKSQRSKKQERKFFTSLLKNDMFLIFQSNASNS